MLKVDLFCSTVNTYAPNTEQDQLPYFENLMDLIKSVDIEESTMVIWGGDFNCALTQVGTEGKWNEISFNK